MQLSLALCAREKKKKEKEEFRRCDCLSDYKLDDLDEGAHAKRTKQAESDTEILGIIPYVRTVLVFAGCTLTYTDH